MKKYFSVNKLSIILIILCFATVCIYGIKKYSENKAAFLVYEKEKECRVLAQLKDAEHNKETSENNIYVTVRYSYNRQDNKCYYWYVWNDGSYWSGNIKDLFTNKNVLTYTKDLKTGEDIQGSEETFNAFSEVYFNQY